MKSHLVFLGIFALLIMSCNKNNKPKEQEPKEQEVKIQDTLSQTPIVAPLVRRNVAALIGSSYYRRLRQLLPDENGWDKADCMLPFVPNPNNFEADIRTNYLLGIYADCEVLYIQENNAGKSALVNYRKAQFFDAGYEKTTRTKLTREFVADLKGKLKNLKLNSVEIGNLSAEFYSKLQKEIDQSDFLQINAKIIRIYLTPDILEDTTKLFDERLANNTPTFPDHTAIRKYYYNRKKIVLGITGLYVQKYTYNDANTVNTKLNQILKASAEVSLSGEALKKFTDGLPSVQASINLSWSKTISEFKEEQFKVTLETPSFYPLGIKVKRK